jgi:hypothetical protein
MANKLNQLKKDPISVIGANLIKCGDTILVSMGIGFVFYALEVISEKHGYNGRLAAPFSEVIKGQLDVMSLVLFYAVVVFYAGMHMILMNVKFVGELMDFLGVESKMDVFYMFVLQCIAAAIGVRLGVVMVKLCFSVNAFEGARVIAMLVAAALVLIGVWYAKGIQDKASAFVLGGVMIAAAVGLYLCLAFSLIQKIVGG